MRSNGRPDRVVRFAHGARFARGRRPGEGGPTGRELSPRGAHMYRLTHGPTRRRLRRGEKRARERAASWVPRVGVFSPCWAERERKEGSGWAEMGDLGPNGVFEFFFCFSFYYYFSIFFSSFPKFKFQLQFKFKLVGNSLSDYIRHLKVPIYFYIYSLYFISFLPFLFSFLPFSIFVHFIFLP
jgi:hypothetical protein